MNFNEESMKLENDSNINENVNLEIKPNTNYVLIKPYIDNPYEKTEVRESGLILDSSTPRFKDPNSGEEEQQETGIRVGKVIEIGPECKFVKPGDDVYYYIASVVPVPFYRQGFFAVAEPRLLMIVGNKLEERFKN